MHRNGRLRIGVAHVRARSVVVAAATAISLAMVVASPAHAIDPPPTTPPPQVNIIVQQWDGLDAAPSALIAQLGGQVTRQLPIVLGFAARVPLSVLDQLALAPGIRAITPDAKVEPQVAGTSLADRPSVYRDVVGANAPEAIGYTGVGSTVAIVDTGVADVPALAGRLKNVVDGSQVARCINLSTEVGCQDSYGHGTFIAGMVHGVAPDARILAVKLSGRDGMSNVSTVLAAIQWVIENRDSYSIDILNLSLRTDSTLSYRVDPMNFAVERAWARGITVVVSAGNQGPGAGTIAKPADDPWVLSVGASDDKGTPSLADDAAADFTSRGPTQVDNLAKPDVAAPGRSLVSLRSPGSEADINFPYFVDDQYRRGSGTSFSAPIVAGAAALLLQADPTATNDRIKFALMNTAQPLGTADALGRGVINIAAALSAPPGAANGAQFQPLLFPLGDPSPADLVGTAFEGKNWQTLVWEGKNWQGKNWQGKNWQGKNWQGSNWQGKNWQSLDWEGKNWQGKNWQAGNWS
jgi:serine protease AprX